MPIGHESILDVNLQKSLSASVILKYTETPGVLPSTPTTIMTFSDVKDRIIGAIWVSGQGYAKYSVWINAARCGTYRSSGNYSENLTMGTSLMLETGDIIDVKVEHFVIGASLDFECSLWGN